MKNRIKQMWKKIYSKIDIYTFVWSIIWAIAFSLCGYNLYNILYNYVQYDTVVSVFSEPPNKTKLPAITICVTNVFTPKSLATFYPGFNKTYQQYLQNKKNHRLPNATEYEQNQKLFDKFESRAFQDYPAYDVITRKSQQVHDVISGCRIYPITVRNMFIAQDLLPKDPLYIDPVDCETIQPHLASIYEGGKCFTFFSDLVEMNDNWWQYFPPPDDIRKLVYEQCLDDTKPCHWFDRLPNRTWIYPEKPPPSDYFSLFYDFRPMIELNIKMDEDSRDFLNNNLMKISVHSSDLLINKRRMKSYMISEAYLYEGVFTKLMVQYMKPPYKPHCSYFGHQATDETLRMFHTSDECRSFCIKNFTLNIDPCLNYYDAITLTSGFESMFRSEHICSHDQQNESLYLEAELACRTKCPEECEQSSFELLDVIAFEKDPLNYRDDYFARILIYISPHPFQTTKHRPAVGYEELIGAIGGNVGIWLGLSIFSVFSLLMKLLQNFLANFKWFQCQRQQ